MTARSFTDIVPKLIATLEDDTALNAFATAKWGKTLEGRVIFSYRKRTELGQSELPHILITRPAVKKHIRVGAKDGDHTVIVYFLFHQDDREKGPLELVEFEELIDDAIEANYTMNGKATNATPEESVNDEGKNHPVYAGVASYTIQHRRTP